MDTEISNRRSGISLIPGVGDGSDKGTAYAAEYLYFDKNVCDRVVYYVKDDTQIALEYNEFFNVVNGRPLTLNSKNEPNTGPNWEVLGAAGGYTEDWTLGAITYPAGPATIRYRVDRDGQFGRFWSGSGAVFPAYTAPFTFAELEYESGVPVVGTTGPKPGQVRTYANRNNYYHRGIEDSVGDEWHALHVGSDNTAILKTNYSVQRASAGKEFLFVVNPKTPCLTVRASGDAEFYTTRPKAYRVPVIHEQTTYCEPKTGGVTFELRDINGNNVFYRIVSDRGDAVTAYTNAGASHVTLDETDFLNGTSYLQYYYAGNSAFTKTRAVVKNPAYPSAGENHGIRLFGTQELREQALARLTRSPYLKGFNYLKKADNLRLATWDAVGESGHRWPWGATATQAFGGSAAACAFIALAEGWDYVVSGSTQPIGRYAKSMLLNGTFARIQDPIGWEDNHPSGTFASPEWVSTGYYNSRTVKDMTYAYEIIAGDFRADQVAGGLTVCEDLFIRDVLGSIALQGISTTSGDHDFPSLGMWYNTWAAMAGTVGMIMPKYSSPVFGTSGYDAVSTGSLNTPFPGDSYTWKEYISDRDLDPGSYPNYRIPFDFGVLVSSEGHWIGAANQGMAYWSHMRVEFGDFLNIEKRHAPLSPTMTSLEAALIKCAAGTMNYTLGDETTKRYFSQPKMGNSYIDFGGNVVAQTKAMAGVTETSIFALVGSSAFTEWREVIKSEQDAISDEGIFGLMWYDDTLPAAGTVGTPQFSVASGTYESARTVAITSATPGATIHYTTNGDTPTSGSATYTIPLVVSASQTIKALARKSLLDDSSVAEATYVIDTSGKPVPVTGLRLV